MVEYIKMSKEQMEAELRAQKAHYDACCAQNLKLNMARGKPAKQQLDAVNHILFCRDGRPDARLSLRSLRFCLVIPVVVALSPDEENERFCDVALWA